MTIAEEFDELRAVADAGGVEPDVGAMIDCLPKLSDTEMNECHFIIKAMGGRIKKSWRKVTPDRLYNLHIPVGDLSPATLRALAIYVERKCGKTCTKPARARS